MAVVWSDGGEARRRSLRRGAPVLALAVAISGCGSTVVERDWAVTVDTLANGTVHVVNVPPPSPAPTWTIEEELRIGTVDEEGATSFGQLKGLAVTADGRIVVLDAQAKELRVFGPDGAHLATYGRKGGGPGELEEPYGLMMGVDGRLRVPDHRNARVSVFDVDAGFVESHAFRVRSWGFVWDGAMGADGRIFEPSITYDEPRRPILRVYDATMTQIDSMPLSDPASSNASESRGAFRWQAPGGGAMGYIQVPFYPKGEAVIDPTGALWSTFPGDPSYRIKRWVPGGDTTLVIETRRRPVPVTQAERDSVIAGIRESLRRWGVGDLDWSRIPSEKPAVSWLFLAEDGRLWAETPSIVPGVRTFDMYGPDGRYAGTAATSLALYRWIRPVVRGDRVWAVVMDDMGVAYVVRARIRPTVGAEGA